MCDPNWSLRSDSNRRPAHYEGGRDDPTDSRCVPLGAISLLTDAGKLLARDAAGPDGMDWDPMVGTELGRMCRRRH
jgi:hypothetical protein